MSSGIPGSSGSGQDTSNQSEVDVLSEGTQDDSSDDTVVSEDTTEIEGESKDEGEASTETSSETSDEEVEEEEELEVEEEVEELDESVEPTRPSWKTIKEKYPELAKDKDFRELYFRDKAFTEVFPTVADAKDAATKAEQLDILDSTLVDGNVDVIFSNLNPDVLNRISDRILPALFKANKDAFVRAAQPIVINSLRRVVEIADRTNDDNLKKSVRNIARAMFGGNGDIPTVKDPISTDPSVEEERNRLKTERENLFRSQQRNFLSSADRTVVKKIESMISEGLDPKGELNSFTKQAIIEKTLADIQTKMLGDDGLRSKLQQLHRLAARSGFADEYKSRIVTASLERARRLIPLLRNKHKLAALGKQSTKGNISQKIVTKNETVTTGGKTGTSTSSGKIDMRKTSAEDFLNDKIVFKK
jgi:hypothetical protein